MKYKLYDAIELKDGKTGCIVECTGDSGYIVDVGESEKDWETIIITEDKIKGLIEGTV